MGRNLRKVGTVLLTLAAAASLYGCTNKKNKQNEKTLADKITAIVYENEGTNLDGESAIVRNITKEYDEVNNVGKTTVYLIADNISDQNSPYFIEMNFSKEDDKHTKYADVLESLVTYFNDYTIDSYYASETAYQIIKLVDDISNTRNGAFKANDYKVSGSYKKAVIDNIKLNSFDEQSETLNFSVDATVCYESFYYVPIKVGKVQTMQKMYNYHYFTKTLDVSIEMNTEYQSNPLKAVKDYLEAIKDNKEHSFEVSESYKGNYIKGLGTKDFKLNADDVLEQGPER